MSKAIVIYCDGGARGNPGPAASAFVVLDDSGEVLTKKGFFLGKTTNNVAEYKAVIFALHDIKNKPVKPEMINFFLDSELVVKQLTGFYKVKDKNLQQLVIEIKNLEKELNVLINYQAIPREKNKIADFLVNETLDKFA